MSPNAASRWFELYEEHTRLRKVGRRASSEIRTALRELAEKGLLKSRIEARLQPKSRSRADLRSEHLREDVPVDRLPPQEMPLSQATLTVELLASSEQLHALVVMVEGKREDGGPWTLAVHLPDDRSTEKAPDGDRQGFGACSHASLHCHVGPNLDTPPKLRVPLPALGPGDLVRWVISQAIPSRTSEPAPWTDLDDEQKSANR